MACLLGLSSCSLMEVRRLFTTDHNVSVCIQTPIGSAKTFISVRSDANDQVRYTTNLSSCMYGHGYSMAIAAGLDITIRKLYRHCR
ncbi:hypothetical protein BJY04DRAFT_180568 [Aspergillus karnatakaensis]|uniref:uncharacterized protein n=1 Tax=Aspergillus karnatakaensis TaxID=1810916 RepID=UPI003CCDF6AA